MSGVHEKQLRAKADLDDAIHELAQPLTALSFLTEVALMQRDPQVWKASLDAAAQETRRAMERLQKVRDAAEQITFDDEAAA